MPFWSGGRRERQNVAPIALEENMLRSTLLLVLAVWLCLSGLAFAEGESDGDIPGSDAESAPAVEDQAPSGPILQPADYAPVLCDPGYAGFRYLEVRGSGFDAWATQRLVGSVVDASGVPQIQWSSIWVSPRGQLTLEVNLCADPFRNRPALPVGDYTVSVGPASGAPLAASTISVSPPVSE
jgi:hypothetical protein